MTAPSDKELRRLRSMLKHDDLDLTPREALAIVDELLAARPVVRVLRKLRAGESTTKSAVAKVLEAYDKARKGRGA